MQTSTPYRKLGSLVIFIFLGLAGLLGFQNCASFKSNVNSLGVYSGSSYCDTSSDLTCGHLTAPTCSFNGNPVANSSSVTAYLSSSVAAGSSCQSQTRTCTNGSLSGNYAFANCAARAAASCLFNGVTVKDGGTATAYLTSSAGSGGACQSQTRTCKNGVLDGTYDFATCTTSGGSSCLFNGVTIAHGASVTGYAASTVPAGSACQSTLRTCLNGTLSGTGDYASCSVNKNADCLFNGQTIASGASVVAYLTSTVVAGQQCQGTRRTCTNGVLSVGGNYASCSVGAAASCVLNGHTIASGGSIAPYTTTAADPGTACVTENRICTNGTLSGSASAESCTVAESKSFPAFQLNSGATLLAGELGLAFQTDGNLVVYRRNSSGTRILWTSQTSGRDCSIDRCSANLQTDGNLVLKLGSTVFWNSQSGGFPGAQLVLSETAPYISIRLNQKTVWSGGAGLKFFTALHTPEGDFNWGGARAGGTVDYLSLFQENSGWNNGLANLDVLKFYTQTLDNLTPDELLNAFAFLKRHHIAVGIESGALPYSGSNPACNIEGMANVDILNVTSQRVIAAGGRLDFIALDEPLNAYNTLKASGTDCGMNSSLTTLAASVHDTYNLYTKYFPSVVMGDVDGADGPTIAAFYDAYRAIENIPFAFYHDDGIAEAQWWQTKTPGVIAAVRARNTSFGFIITPSADDFSEIAAIARAVGRYVKYHQLGLAEPDQYIVQSWETYPKHVLPEGAPTSLTFLLNYLNPVSAASGFDTNSIQIFRFLTDTGDRFMTAAQSEGTAAGYILEGGAFRLFASPSPVRLPIYRCISGGAHFLSGDAKCEGSTVEGIIGYAESSMSSGAPHPIFRCVASNGSGRHLITASPLECSLLGFTPESYIGFGI